ncbi:hypothetical protein AAY23_11514 [Frankia casuarinae]|nr:hypothetical protein AAY23_11514 [Frankia casuarinae]
MPLPLSRSSCYLGFRGVGEPDRGRGVVAEAALAGFLDRILVVARPADDAGVGAFAAGVEPGRSGDVGGGLTLSACPLVRGKKPGR